MSEQWEWEDKELKLSQCGNPNLLVERIMTKHVYQPHVSDSVIRRNQTFLKAFHGVDPHLDLLKAWDERQTETKLQTAAIEAFGKPHAADSDNLGSFYNDRTCELSNIIETLPGNHKDKYDAVEMVDGFVA